MDQDRIRLWLVIPQREAGARAATHPLAFSSAQRMAEWLSAKNEEDHWHIRLFDADSIESVLAELLQQGYSEIALDEAASAAIGDATARKLPQNSAGT